MHDWFQYPISNNNFFSISTTDYKTFKTLFLVSSYLIIFRTSQFLGFQIANIQALNHRIYIFSYSTSEVILLKLTIEVYVNLTIEVIQVTYSIVYNSPFHLLLSGERSKACNIYFMCKLLLLSCNMNTQSLGTIWK
jgi:hypothetical protein